MCLGHYGTGALLASQESTRGRRSACAKNTAAFTYDIAKMRRRTGEAAPKGSWTAQFVPMHERGQSRVIKISGIVQESYTRVSNVVLFLREVYECCAVS